MLRFVRKAMVNAAIYPFATFSISFHHSEG